MHKVRFGYSELYDIRYRQQLPTIWHVVIAIVVPHRRAWGWGYGNLTIEDSVYMGVIRLPLLPFDLKFVEVIYRLVCAHAARRSANLYIS